jgi:Fe-S cluster assembly protein SufD
MSQAVKEKSSYRQAFEELAGGDGRAPGWLRSLREDALGRFESSGFPTTDEEAWKYTNVGAIARADFRPATRDGVAAVGGEQVEPFIYEESRRSRLVFVDGRLRPELSSTEALDSGVVAKDLSEAAAGEHGEFLRAALTEAEGKVAAPFRDLNTAFLSSGAFVRVPRGVKVESPIHLLFLSTARETAAFPRVLVVAEPESSATIIESYDALAEGAYFTNAVVEVSVGDGARLNHYKVQTEGAGAFHVASTSAALGRASVYDLTTITLGARLSRHDIDVKMWHEGAEVWVDGLYLVGDGQHADTHSLIDHLVPRCVSHQNYKGILDGRSRAVFNGRVYVHPDAQQTDAFQSNKNLLLSPHARVDTKPQLEIFADDVKCAHGATVGQLEEEELFYLVSRGLNPTLARNLLTYGFAEEIVEKIKIESIKGQLDAAILNRLHADFAA